jgi:hypothetical protein
MTTPPQDPLGGIPPAIQNMIAVPFLIGSIAMEWSKVEFLLCWIAARLMSTTLAAGERVIRGVGSAAQMDLVQSLAGVSAYSQEIKDDIAALAGKFKAAGDYRNKIVHAHWAGIDDKGQMLTRRVTGRGPRPPLPQVVVEEVPEMISGLNAIGRVASAIMDIVRKMDLEIPENQKRLKV